jgi:hypothetical protein
LGLLCDSVLGRMSISFACEPFSIIRGSAIEVLKQSNWIALLPPLPTISNEFM